MGVKEYLRQSDIAKELSCDRPSRITITSWLKKFGWNFEDFPILLNLMHLKKPIKAITQRVDGPIAISTDKFMYDLHFCSGNTIALRYGDVTEHYQISRNDSSMVRMVKLSDRSVSNTDKHIRSEYTDYSCHRTVTFDNINTYLKVDFSEPSNISRGSEMFVHRNKEQIENFLLNLDKEDLMANGIVFVYSQMRRYLAFSQEEIDGSAEIRLVFCVDDKIQSGFQISYGRMLMYATTINGDLYQVYHNGSWNYESDGCKIRHDSEGISYLIKDTMHSKLNKVAPLDKVEQVTHMIKKIQDAIFMAEESKN